MGYGPWGHKESDMTELLTLWASQDGAGVKNPPAGDIRDMSLIPGLGSPLEKEMATHFCILAWKIPWTEEPGGPKSIGSQRVRRE